MKEIGLEEVKKIELELLLKFDAICTKHNLRYFLGYGTLIGAVRHQGFIPWDDDIDVVMPRPDYEKLNQLIGNQNIDNRYCLLNSETKDYIYSFSKFVDLRTQMVEKWMISNVLGVYIDVIPLDGVPADTAERKHFYDKLMFYHYGLLMSTRVNKSRRTLLKTIASRIMYYPVKLVGYKNWRKKVQKLCNKYPYEESEYIGNLSLDTYLRKECYPKAIFDNTIRIMFEGHLFCVPERYDELLRHIYGDYMVLPPIEQRVKKHENKAYWK